MAAAGVSSDLHDGYAYVQVADVRERLGPEGQARLIESLHTRRLGEAADIASAMLFLASDRAAWIPGQILSVDGRRS